MSSNDPLRVSCSFILNRDVILVSHQKDDRNYSSVMTRIKNLTMEIPISEAKQKLTLRQESHVFSVHLIIQGGNVFGCIAQQDVPLYECFLFLSKVLDQMAAQPSLVSRSYHAAEHEFDRDLQPVLSNLMDDINQGRIDDKLTTVQIQVQDVKEVLLENVEKLVKRGELLEDLLDKTEVLVSQGRSFQSSARTLQVRLWWKNVKLWVAIGVVVLIPLVLLILYLAGVFKKS